MSVISGSSTDAIKWGLRLLFLPDDHDPTTVALVEVVNMNHSKFVRQFFKNRRYAESEEHDILRRVPKHFRGDLRKALRMMVSSGELYQRKANNRLLYKLKK